MEELVSVCFLFVEGESGVYDYCYWMDIRRSAFFNWRSLHMIGRSLDSDQFGIGMEVIGCSVLELAANGAVDL